MKKILIIEDDPLIADIERDYLEINDFEVTISLSGREGLNLALGNDYDLVILDVMLPELNGFEICREIRKEKNTAIIMVTAKKQDVDKIRGLGLGADDYMIKPFSPSELAARVKAHINIHERLKEEAVDKNTNFKKGSITVQHIEILPLSRQVYVYENEVFMANKEFELLCFLANNPNIVFSKDVLFERIWGLDSNGDAATVTVHINRIREKIEIDSSNPRIIETVWGAGYRLRLR